MATAKRHDLQPTQYRLRGGNLNDNPLFQWASLRVSLFLGTPIIPGQDIVFRWESQHLGFRALDLGTVAVTLQLLDKFGNLDPNGILREYSLTKADANSVARNSLFQSNDFALSLTDDEAKRLYQVGEHTMILTLSATGMDAGPYQSAPESLIVQLPIIDDSWWTWNIPQANVPWKRNYVVAGALTNPSMATLTGTVTLLESRAFEDNPEQSQPVGADTLSTPVAAQQNVAVTFGQMDLTKKWQWFVPGVFIPDPTGYVNEYFGYQARLDLTDQYQNGYPAFLTTSRAIVEVDVSGQKQAALGTAIALETGAIVCLATAAAGLAVPIFGEFAAGVWAGVAAGLEAAAQIAGVVAGDPPVPDPRYRITVQPAPVTMPAASRSGKLRNPLEEFARAVFEVIAHVEAILATDSRITGARVARKQRYVDAQTRHFKYLCAKLPALARTVERRTEPAARLMLNTQERQSAAAWDKTTQTLTRNLQVRSKLSALFTAAGGSADDLATLFTRAATPEFGAALSNSQAVIAAASLATRDLARLSAAMKPTDVVTLAGRARR